LLRVPWPIAAQGQGNRARAKPAQDPLFSLLLCRKLSWRRHGVKVAPQQIPRSVDVNTEIRRERSSASGCRGEHRTNWPLIGTSSLGTKQRGLPATVCSSPPRFRQSRICAGIPRSGVAENTTPMRPGRNNRASMARSRSACRITFPARPPHRGA